MASLSRETLDLLRRVSTATLTTQLFKRGLRNAFMQGVRPLGRYGGNLVGPAFTRRSVVNEISALTQVFVIPAKPRAAAGIRLAARGIGRVPPEAEQ